LTKFVLQRALQSKRAEEVAYQLTDIFWHLVPRVFYIQTMAESFSSLS
jgi:hypothetical protein